MTLLAFQQTLAALVASPELRRRAEAGDERDWPPTLDARERRRLRVLARAPGLRTGTIIHRSFRLSMLSTSLPRTCKALGAQAIKALTHDFWRAHPPRSLLYRREALRFARYALPRLRAGEFANAWLPEVLEAEARLLELLEEADAGQAVAPTGPGDGPRLAPGCRVVCFRAPPLTVLNTLAEGRLPEESAPGEHYLLLRCLGPGRVDLRALDAAHGRLLSGLAPARAADDEALDVLRTEGLLID
jgi:hypothetical protein